MTFDVNKIRLGDEVGVDDPKYPGRWRVQNFGPRNITLVPVMGGRGLRCPRYMITEPSAEAASLPKFLYPGQICKGRSPKLAGNLWVVTGSRNGRYQIAMLGGDGYNGYNGVSAAALVPVDMGKVLRPLSEIAADAPQPPVTPPLAPVRQLANGAALGLVAPSRTPPAPAPPAGLHAECERCGYRFPKPQARATCQSTSACGRRAAKRGPASARG